MEFHATLAALEQNGFRTQYFSTAAEAADALCNEFHGISIGMGGSMTLLQMGLYERLCEENTVFWHWKQPGAQTLQQAMHATVYLVSANAISQTGELVNIDGIGNRLAATLYGHERVIYLVGINKLAPTLDEAIARARNIAAPLNARRLHCQTPCVLSEPMRCHDCHSSGRICNAVSVLARPMGGITQTDVVLIGESLGY